MSQLAPNFPCDVTTEGNFVTSSWVRTRYRAWKDTLRGEACEFSLRKAKSKRSLNQNAYAHAVPFTLIGDYLGYELSEIKLVLLGECFGWQDIAGHQLPIKVSTAALTVDEFSHFIEWMPRFAIEQSNGDLYIPLPDDADWGEA